MVDWPIHTWTYRALDGTVQVEILDIETCAIEILKKYTAYIIISCCLAMGETVALFSMIVQELTWLPAYLKKFADIFLKKETEIL